MERRDFEELARKIRPRVISIALKLLSDADEAEDVAQETLLKMWSLRDRLGNYTSVEGLAVVIARNRCLDIARRRSRNFSVSLDEIDVADVSLTPEQTIIDGESEAEAHSLIGRLPEGQQIVLRMKHVEGLEVDEIAALTGSSPNAIRVTLSRARHRVKELFNTSQSL